MVYLKGWKIFDCWIKMKKKVNIFLYGIDYKIGEWALYIYMLTLLRFTNKMNTPTFVLKILRLTHSDVWPTPAFDPFRRLRLLRLTTPTFDHSEVWDSYVCRGTLYTSASETCWVKAHTLLRSQLIRDKDSSIKTLRTFCPLVLYTHYSNTVRLSVML